MAFLNVTMPELKLVHGMRKSSSNPVNVLTNGTFEYRLKKSKFDRFVYSFPSRAILNESKLALYQFYSTVEGPLYSFKFKDFDNKWSGQQLTTYIGSSAWEFHYPGNRNHPLWKYDSGMVVKVNGTPTAFTHSVVNNVARLTVSGSNSNSVVTIDSGNIYLVGRFSSEISWSLSALDSNNQPLAVDFDAVNIQEVYEA